MRPSGPRQNRRELKIDARSVEVPFHPSWLTRQSREMRDIRQETGRQVGPQRVPVLLFQHVRYKYFSICCLTSCQQGSGKFLSIRTKRIATPWRSDSGTTVSPVEREKRIDKKGGGPSFLVARYICRSNGPTWGRPASCHANIPRKYHVSRDDRVFSFRSEQLHQPRPHVERIDGSRNTIRRFPLGSEIFLWIRSLVWRLHFSKINF